MADIYDKNKPYPEKRPDEPRKKKSYSVWTIVGILIVLALLIWIFAFSYGDENAARTSLETARSIFTEAGVLSG